MSPIKNWKSMAIVGASSVGMALVMQACGGGSDAHAQSTVTPDAIEGLWQSNVTLKDCASGATVGGFRGLTLFAQGGTAQADNDTPSAGKGPAMGTWTKSATGAYTVSLRFWRYTAAGLPAGQQRLTRSITLAADGQTLTATISTEALDTADVVVLRACGVETGAKIG
ncbi:MAG: hypothetical protein M3Y32_14610 [Pseudomonadota bacterium]|nr:hypothetical protein [Pseudomonadota bacterium]